MGDPQPQNTQENENNSVAAPQDADVKKALDLIEAAASERNHDPKILDEYLGQESLGSDASGVDLNSDGAIGAMDELDKALQAKLGAMTPEFIEKTVDDFLANPENIKLMEAQGVTVAEVNAMKPKIIEGFSQQIEALRTMSPELLAESKVSISDQIAKAQADFPAMLDDAIRNEVTSGLKEAEERRQNHFNESAARMAEGEKFLENGERPTAEGSKIAKAYDAGVISMADTIMTMMEHDPTAYDQMKPSLEGQGAFGKDVIELMDSRISENKNLEEGVGLDNPSVGAGTVPGLK